MVEPEVDLVIPDPELSLEDGAIVAWKKCGSGLRGFYPKSIRFLARKFKISVKTPWKSIPQDTKDQILFGNNKSPGSRRSGYWPGIIPNLVYRFHNTDSETLNNVSTLLSRLPWGRNAHMIGEQKYA